MLRSSRCSLRRCSRASTPTSYPSPSRSSLGGVGGRGGVVRRERRMLGAFLWLFPTFIVGGFVLLLSRVAEPLANTVVVLIAAMTLIGLIVFTLSRDVAIFPVDAGLLFEEFFFRIQAGGPGLRLPHLLFAAHHPVRLGLPDPLAIHRQCPFLRRRPAASVELLRVRSIFPSSASAPLATATSFPTRALRACSPRSRWCAASCCSCSAYRSSSNIRASGARRTASRAVLREGDTLTALKQRSGRASVMQSNGNVPVMSQSITRK